MEVIALDKNFIFYSKNNVLIIEKCPNAILTNQLLSSISNIDQYNIIYICEGIKEIGEECFSDINVQEIYLPDSLNKLHNHAFYNSNISEIRLPDSIQEIPDGCFQQCSFLKRVKLSSNLITLGEKAFALCDSLEKIYIPYGITSIPRYCFFKCKSLKEITLPNNLKEIKTASFASCTALKKIYLPNTVNELGKECFSGCDSLEEVRLSPSIKVIPKGIFSLCSSLIGVVIPEGVQEIGDLAFEYCYGMKNVVFPSSLKKIGRQAFKGCHKIKEINKNNCIEVICEEAFEDCKNLKKVYLNDTLKELQANAFRDCQCLEFVTFSSRLKVIAYGAFYNCSALSSIIVKDGTEKIEQLAFAKCINLRSISLPTSLKRIYTQAFEGDSSIEEAILPKGLEILDDYAFEECSQLKYITLPSTLKYFGYNSIGEGLNLEYIVLDINGEKFKINMKNKELIYNDDKKVFIYDRVSQTYGFYENGKYIYFNEKYFSKRILKLIKDERIDENGYIRLYHWNDKKVIPNYYIIKYMPLKDIDKYYVNNNYLIWNRLICNNFSIVDNKVSFFKLCYVLGVFSESSSIRDDAVKFIKEKILKDMDEYAIHNRFDGFDLKNGFNLEYARFFMKYYNGEDFMVYKDEKGNEIDLIAASYNNFKNVAIYYPGKIVQTNRKVDRLTPNIVMHAVTIKSYSNVRRGNEALAMIVGKYGYTQEQFDKIQDWYDIGKKLESKSLFIANDEVESTITYELLGKNNPIVAVLGNITNCCQIVNGLAETCLEYGMTKENSGFITFKCDNLIIGQSWVWYDENSKIVCLDNIEIPHKYFKKIFHDINLQKQFIECLSRLTQSIKKAMEENNLLVNKITIGEGHNDLKFLLSKYFEYDTDASNLSSYIGYTDADIQYLVYTNKPKKNL